MVQLKMRIIDQAQNKENLRNSESEFNCYKCFKIMILNLWSAH